MGEERDVPPPAEGGSSKHLHQFLNQIRAHFAPDLPVDSVVRIRCLILTSLV